MAAGVKHILFSSTAAVYGAPERVPVAEDDPTELEPGMVITVEPGFATDYGTFHVEENALCTDEGFTLLSTAPRSLASMPLDSPSLA